ncbi:hypothetical protein [Trichloromonas sp.]|uniref:hypothetical protein n=1 Tax=Trichloromonas sp. TaxID=3069249 RepID=UPI003D8173FB
MDFYYCHHCGRKINDKSDIRFTADNSPYGQSCCADEEHKEQGFYSTTKKLQK